MASGTGNLPNPGMDFTPFDILTAEEMDDLVENIESLADGTGIGDGSVTTNTLAQSAVTDDKVDYTTFDRGTDANGWRVSQRPDGRKEYSKTIGTGTAISLGSGLTTEYSFGSGPVGVNPATVNSAHLTCWGGGTSGQAFAFGFRLRVVNNTAGEVFVKVTNPYSSTTSSGVAVNFTATLIV